MNKNPETTIVITNYNYEKYIYAAFLSAYQQNYDGILNIVIVNDGSTDDSAAMIETQIFGCCRSISDDKVEYKRSILNQDFYKGPIEIQQGVYEEDCGPRDVILININNSGASVARNVGITYALRKFRKTKVIGILDADDEYYPNKVQRLCDKLVEHKHIGLAYSDYYIEKTFDDKSYTKYEYKKPYSMLQLQRECIISSGSLIKVEYLKQIANGNVYYDPNLHGPGSEDFIGCTEDYDLWLRLTRKCIACHVAEPLSIAREHGENASHKMTSEIFQKNAQIMGSK